MSRQSKAALARVARAAALTLFFAWTLAPIAWLVASSLLMQTALTSVPPDLSPSALTLDNYRGVAGSAAAIGLGLFNSSLVAFSTTALAVALGAPAAYALARLSLPGSHPILMTVLATQMFPSVVVAIPLFILLSRAGMIDTHFALIVTYLSFNLPAVIWILHGFFLGIPRGLERAAAIDGASMAETFRLVVLPISWPPLFAAAIFAFIESWNEFFFALILTRQSTQTMPIVISQFAGQYQTLFGQMMAAAAIAIAPVVILSIIFRNLIMRGFTEGMLKG